MAKTLKAIGRTLYADFTNTTDVGLTLASGAPVIVLQEDADGNYSVEEYTSIAQALDAVEDSDNYKGVIAAALNDKGTAEFIVLSSATQLTDNSKDDDNKKANVKALDATAKTGEGKIDVTVTLSANAAADKKVDVTLKVLNGGTWVDVDTYTVEITKGSDNGKVTIDGLADAQYKVICGDLSKTVAVK